MILICVITGNTRGTEHGDVRIAIDNKTLPRKNLKVRPQPSKLLIFSRFLGLNQNVEFLELNGFHKYIYTYLIYTALLLYYS